MLIYRARPAGSPISHGTMLVSPTPFDAEDRAAAAAEAEREGFDTVLTPDTAIRPIFARLAAPGGPGDAVDSVAEDISPPTDNRPFFFQMADLSTFFQGEGFRNDTYVTRPVLVLSMLAVAVLILALVFIVLPLLFTTKRSEHKGMAPFYAYFTGIGLGFMFIEISQLQRLSIFLGSPTASLAVVLFSVLLFSGIGSMLTERFVKSDNPRSYVVPLLCLLAVVVLFGLVTPEVFSANDGQTTPVRIAIAVAMLAPLSLGLGMPFVIGMRAANARGNAPTAFLWGINGAASVCASVFAVVVAVFFGISAAFWTGAVAYVVATVAISVIARAQQRREAVPSEPEPVEVPSPVGV
jgi:hypothetical protein